MKTNHSIRPFSEDLVPAIKEATVKAVTIIRGFDVAASYTRVQKTQLHGYANINQPYIVPLDVAIDLDQAAHCFGGHAPILTAYANALGYWAIPNHIGPGDFGQDMGEFAETSGDILATAMRILSDGRIDPHEAQEITPKLAHAKLILERALACVHKIQTDNMPHMVSEREAE